MSRKELKLSNGNYMNIRSWLIPYIDSYENIRDLTIIMNIATRDKMSFYLKDPICYYLFGAEIKLANIKDDTIIFVYNDSENEYIKNDIKNTLNFMNSLHIGYGGFTKENPTLPDRYIVNKDAVILFYGNNKTIVRRSKVDKVDFVKAFLWAYFLRNTGMSRTKANKYLFKVWKSGAEVSHKK